MSSDPFVLILAGGSGTRLKPLCSELLPKQFLKINSDLSLLQMTVLRFLKLFSSKQIYIITSEPFLKETKKHLEFLSSSLVNQIIVEPKAKNTAFAITWAIKELRNQFKKEFTLLVSPIDHIFLKEETFLCQIEKSFSLFRPSHLLAYGTEPERIDTELGYLKKGSKLTEQFFNCSSFTEKPGHEQATDLIKDSALWNLGLYMFFSSTYIEELKLYLPLHAKILLDPQNDLDESIPSLSIDKGLVQQTKHLDVFECKDLTWLDIGTWPNLSRYLKEREILLIS